VFADRLLRPARRFSAIRRRSRLPAILPVLLILTTPFKENEQSQRDIHADDQPLAIGFFRCALHSRAFRDARPRRRRWTNRCSLRVWSLVGVDLHFAHKAAPADQDGAPARSGKTVNRMLHITRIRRPALHAGGRTPGLQDVPAARSVNRRHDALNVSSHPPSCPTYHHWQTRLQASASQVYLHDVQAGRAIPLPERRGRGRRRGGATPLQAAEPAGQPGRLYLAASRLVEAGLASSINEAPGDRHRRARYKQEVLVMAPVELTFVRTAIRGVPGAVSRR